jgi:hypothetical protein
MSEPELLAKPYAWVIYDRDGRMEEITTTDLTDADRAAGFTSEPLYRAAIAALPRERAPTEREAILGIIRDRMMDVSDGDGPHADAIVEELLHIAAAIQERKEG